MRVEELLRIAKDRAASDVVIVADASPFMRLDGEWVPIVPEKMSSEECDHLIRNFIHDDQLDALRSERELNFSRQYRSLGRLRFNVHYQRDSLAVTIRLIWPEVRSVESLQLSTDIRSVALRHHGLILVCGRSGSGKSTTLAALVQHILANRRAHVITIEDPIEYVHENGQGVVEQRELYLDTMGWDSALKNVLRQAPDVIVIGELQDRHSIASAVSAAETGHLVLASIHANDAVNCVTRVIDVFPGDQQMQVRIQLASTLAGVLVQDLVPTSSGEGRVLATEFMVPNPAIRNLIRTGSYNQIHNTMMNGRAHGMHTMEDSLERLLFAGQISQEQVLLRMSDRRLVTV